MKQSLLKLVTPRHDDYAGDVLIRPVPDARVLFVTQFPCVLTGLRVEYDTCNTSGEAVRLAQSQPYIAIFIDLAELRCRSSGTQIIFSLRSANVLTPVILMSSSASVVDRIHAIRRGAAALIARNAEAIMQILSGVTPSVGLRPAVIEPPLDNDVRKKIIYLLGDFTGPAAEDQAQNVIRQHGEGISIPAFAKALADFISSPRDQALFIKQAASIHVASTLSNDPRSFDDE